MPSEEDATPSEHSTQVLDEKDEEIARLREQLAAKEGKGVAAAIKKTAEKTVKQTTNKLKHGVGAAAKIMHLAKGDGKLVKLDVTVLRAWSLPGISRKGTCNAFADVQISKGAGGMWKFKTKAIPKSTHPHWNEQATLDITPGVPVSVLLTISSKDSWSSTALGHCEIDIDDPTELLTKPIIYHKELLPCKGDKLLSKHGSLGSVAVALRSGYASGVAVPDLDVKPSHIEISLIGAQGLRGEKKNVKKGCNAYTVVEVKGPGITSLTESSQSDRRTAVIASPEPEWGDRFTYRYSGEGGITIESTVKHRLEDSEDKDTFLGFAEITCSADQIQHSISAAKKKKVPLGPHGTHDADMLTKLTKRAKLGMAKAKIDKENHFLGGLGYLYVAVRSFVDDGDEVLLDTDKGRPGGAEEGESDSEDDNSFSKSANTQPTTLVGSKQNQTLPYATTLDRQGGSYVRNGLIVSSSIPVLDVYRSEPKMYTHLGQYRDSTFKMCCSTSDSVEGTLCTHGSIITVNHWSCCGQFSLYDPCIEGPIGIFDEIAAGSRRPTPLGAIQL
eukprot:TRINITY_DN9522_c1_g1_i1.p1 TRINITY_DN9522_c1_g1~~TRINITY_DN9522_c1_g1_i1.p1  ORF type:complete len:557 (+),score=98.75 TRINITY_DN9522_c1_g1_i1:24-1694(+)